MLQDDYIKKYLGKFLSIDNSVSWVELVEVKVCANREPIYRHLDYMLDALGNQWWVKNELEPAMAAGKILSKDELPEDSNVIERS